jgi:hypothetical protein
MAISIRRVRQLRNQIRNEATKQTAKTTAAVQNQKRRKHLNDKRNLMQFPNRASLTAYIT